MVANPTAAALHEQGEDETPSTIATVIDRLAQDPPRNWSTETHQRLVAALQRRYHGAQMIVPVEISSTILLFDLLSKGNELVRLVQRSGPKGTESLELSKIMLESAELRDINYQQVASTLLFMAIARDRPAYDLNNFIAALREHRGGQRLDWQDVVHAFDREGLKITKDQFHQIFVALTPLAKEYENFDLQLLWGGDWHHGETQLAFASAFLSFSQDELDASEIPRLRRAYTLEDFQDASEDVKTYAKLAVRHPLVSVDATKALFDMVFRSSETYAHAQSLGVVENVINPKMDLFVCSVSAVPKPWGATQDQAMKQLVQPFFLKAVTGHKFVFHILWKRDKHWLSSKLQQFYKQDNMTVMQIYEHAEEHGWLNDLVAVNNDLSLDLAALAHGRDAFNLKAWLEQIAQAMPGPNLLKALSGFLRNKADDDAQFHREGIPHGTYPLSIKTVHAFLIFLGEAGLPEDDRVQLHRACITAYPRLINYGEGYDAIIDANGRDGNGISPEADAKMQEHYKHMYNGESQVRDIIEVLQKYKTSDDPAEQDLFACMIYGLFDEYNCFHEYPLDALATTAVLFGSIINYNLLSRIALQASLAMVLDAVRQPPNESMYKFGLQALLNFEDRLDEWRLFCERLLLVPGLRGTAIYTRAEQVVQDQQEIPGNLSTQEQETGDGTVDEFLAMESKVPDFTCLSVDPSTRQDFYVDPGEEIQETILFILNNVSERNLETKTKDLRSKLSDEHHQWFANYLVASCIKLQPNYHRLYMDLLDGFKDKTLWGEVLRETYVSSIKMLNAESTMNASSERTQLKTLASWLGSMTLARNRPIRYRNISFKDLLIEAYDTQRLLVAIPFICKAMAMAATSLVFRPPCAWTDEILSILIELYEFADLKLNLKFEIEVLCKALNVDHKTIMPSDAIRSRPQQDDEMLPTALSDGIDGFGKLSLVGFNRRNLNERFLPSTMVPELAEISANLKHNYVLPANSASFQARLRHLIASAVERSVSEIIGPVVERSVTIAAISTSQLIAKDFALEPDEARYQQASQTSVKALSGSLALVTCKEPLRMSMRNNISSMARSELGDTAMPEGSITMFVNDNLETVCSIIEKAAESASVAEIDAQIEDAIRARRNNTFSKPPVSRWAMYVPDPYKPSPGGLNDSQMSIYENFSQPAQGYQVNAGAQDNGRPMSDVLNDQYPAIPNLATPAEGPTMQRGMNPQLVAQTSAPSSQHGAQAHMVNGYVSEEMIIDRVPDLVMKILRAAKEAADGAPGLNLTQVASVQDSWSNLEILIKNRPPTSRDNITVVAAQEIYRIMYSESLVASVAQVLAEVLAALCHLSEAVGRFVYGCLTGLDEARLFDPVNTVALLRCDLMNIRRIDHLLARSLLHHRPEGLNFLDKLVEEYLLSDPPALRADLANSLASLAQWLTEEPDLPLGREITRRLQGSPIMPGSPLDDVSSEAAQADYILDEWERLQEQETAHTTIISFTRQLHDRGILSTSEHSAVFFRRCIDAAVIAYEREETSFNASIDRAYVKVDALAKLIVVLASHQVQNSEPERTSRIAFFETTMALVILTFAHHYRTRVPFNQKVFFRLLSSIIHEIHSSYMLDRESQQEMLQVVAKHLMTIQPQTFGSFAFAWLSLLSHRMFFPALLRGQDPAALALYCGLLEKLLNYLGELMKPLEISIASKDLYRGTLRLFLVLHHDFPDFLAEHYFLLLNQIPGHCAQLRSLIISASPTTLMEQPDPFTEGLKVDRLEEVRKTPLIRGDIEKPLHLADVMTPLKELLEADETNDAALGAVVNAVHNPVVPETGVGFAKIGADTTLLHALVLYCAKHAEMTSRQKVLTFSADSPHARFLESLLAKLLPEARYYMIGAIANQLRYPNSHTHFFSYAVFHLFRAGQTDEAANEIQMQMTRVLLERLIAHRPYSWGLIITLLEVLQNRAYRFWDLPFVKAAPEVSGLLHVGLAAQANQVTARTHVWDPLPTHAAQAVETRKQKES